MAFYIKPPEGFGSLGKLRVYALRRMNFLMEVLNCTDATDFQKLLENGATALDSDCLIEGSRKDRISHFLLRLICSPDAELSSYIVKAETELFCHRFSCMNSEELVHFLKATYRFLCRLQRRQKASQGAHPVRPVLSSISKSHEAQSVAVCNLLHTLDLILEAAGSWEEAVKLYMDYSPCVFTVPFQHALCLVASRQVMVDRGMAFVPFSNLHVVLAAMFEDILREGTRVARHVPQRFLEDSRMRSISREVHSSFLRAQSGFRSHAAYVSGNGKVIREYQIDDLHHIFPPCMSHLHRTLLKKHRLRHFSRIQYTLFLKSIGLPVGDAIHFWRGEYSKPSHCHDNQGGGCQHSWGKDERRYTYNIRHLYGLEGSKTNYRAHSCKAIQTMQLGYGEEGGCPFKHFDDHSFQGLMDIEEIVEPQREEITLERQTGKFNVACRKYLCAKKRQIDWKGYGGEVEPSAKKLKQASYQSEESIQKPEVIGDHSEDRSLTCIKFDPVDIRDICVTNTKDKILKSEETLIERTGENCHNIHEVRPDVLQTTESGNVCKEGSIYKHLNNYQPSMNASASPNTPSENRRDIACHEETGDTPLLQSESAAAHKMCNEIEGRHIRHLSVVDSSMFEKDEIQENTLKRESAMATEGNNKVPKMILDLKESDVILEGVRIKQEDDLEERTKLHEDKSVIAPSCDMVESLSDAESRETMSSSKTKPEGDLTGFSSKVEELCILRPADFYYSFRRMMEGLNQNKLTA